MDAPSVLDVGCGTGRLLHRAREAGHTGRLCGVDRGSLRFLDVEGIDAFLGDAGFEVEARYGDWSRGPLTGASDNIVTVARAA